MELVHVIIWDPFIYIVLYKLTVQTNQLHEGVINWWPALHSESLLAHILYLPNAKSGRQNKGVVGARWGG